MINEKGFDIRHFSVHEGCSGNGVKWINVNIVFKVSDEYQGYVSNACQDWLYGVLYEVDDSRDITDFYESQPIETFRLNQHPSKRTGLMMNDDNFLTYVSKFDVYRFSEIVEDNRVTRAVLRELASLHCDDVQGRFVPITRFMRCLRTLFTFWD